ncbi:MAG: anti-sigma factor domain-containing protein [Actinomycetota bacterium]
MRKPLTHEEIKALVAPYVLGALPEDEIPAVRSHLPTCEECMVEAEELSSIASGLTMTVAAEEPPAGFADRVFERLNQEASSVVEPSRWGGRRFLPALGVAALLALTAVFGGAWLDARNDLRERDEVVQALLARDGMELGGSGATGKMVPTDDGAIFAATGLEAPAEGETYQLWVMKGACGEDETGLCEIESVGTFDASGGPVVVETSKSIEGFEHAAVTVEPDGGSDQPTTEPVITSV